MLSPRIMLKLLEEARGVPVMFAIMLPSGNIVFEVSILRFLASLNCDDCVVNKCKIHHKTGIYGCHCIAKLEDGHL